jgi:DNA polymerase-3 subunit beta
MLRNVYPDKKVIVPGKSLNEISKILSGGAEDDVEISFTPNHILFEFENTKVVSRLIEGKFFDVEKMNIKDYETKVKVNRKNFLDCIDRGTLLVKEGDKKPIILNVADDNVTIMINSFMGSMKEELPIEKTGKDIMIGFNPKFMLDALRAVEDEDVELYFVNSKAPCFIKNNSESYVYVVLPVNFSSVP